MDKNTRLLRITTYSVGGWSTKSSVLTYEEFERALRDAEIVVPWERGLKMSDKCREVLAYNKLRFIKICELSVDHTGDHVSGDFSLDNPTWEDE